jgi:aminopeptidase N
MQGDYNKFAFSNCLNKKDTAILQLCSMKSLLKIILLSSVTLHSASGFTQKIENGVSEILANYRAKVLSDVRYELSFSIPLDKKDSIAASETILFKLNENKQPLQLDFKETKEHVKQVIVNGASATFQLLNEHIIVDNKFLKQGNNKIEITFTAGELSLNRNNDYLYTLLVPDRARTVFPCFDQPNLKAKFRLKLSVPDGWEALANGQAQSVNVSGNKKNYVFAESDLFSTYLFAFVAGKFDLMEKQVGEHFMRFYFREKDSTKLKLSIDSIFELHNRSIDFLEDYTQIKFPFQKLDFAAIPDFQYGGMEHVGAIDYKAASLFLDSGATKDQLNARANLIAHETSHMWFGDLVTMRWFNDVWMKEVFANFFADKITQGNQTDNSYELKFLLDHYSRAYAVDRTKGANSIRQDLPNLDQAGSLYGGIIYDKAPVMMRQLERLIGKDVFRDGLREYLKKYSYSNASWPDLISILDRRSPADLKTWNQVWVNTPGRPVFEYSMENKNGVISRFVVTQKGEQKNNYILPQFFEIALVYADHIDEVTVNMNQQQAIVTKAVGKQMPLYMLFNSSGQGYGVFPFDKNGIEHLKGLKNPVMRASAYINLYENMLNGNKIAPKELFAFLNAQLKNETEELNLNLITGYIGDIFWRLLLPEERTAAASSLENLLWTQLQNEKAPGKKKIFFRTCQSIAITRASLDTLHWIWKQQVPPTGVKLNPDDYTSLALNLAVKEFPDTTMLTEQMARLADTDKKSRLAFLIPSASADEKVRDEFFQSLKDVNVRKKEAWVADALLYLHHPLRANTSIKYLKPSLDMLEDVQRTGDIFFPASWLNSSLRYYQSKEAVDIINAFINSHPNYNPQLKMKLLQAADPVFRAEKLTTKAGKP